jgi:hypothetical protein
MAQHRLGRRSPLITEAKPDTKILDELLPRGCPLIWAERSGLHANHFGLNPFELISVIILRNESINNWGKTNPACLPRYQWSSPVSRLGGSCGGCRCCRP